MRWTAKPPRKKYKPADGDQRVVHSLLLWPVCLDGEWRWMEWNYILQIYDEYQHHQMDWGTYGGWKDAHWN